MALVTKITHDPLQANAVHRSVDCTYDVVTESDGTRYLQLDTFGSGARQLKGKKSQTMRLSPKAIADLKSIIAKHGL